MLYFAVILIILIIGFCRSEWEKKQLSVETYVIESDKLKEDKTIVFISDVHDRKFNNGKTGLLSAVDEIKPDAVLIGGDTMVCKKKCDIKMASELIKKLAEKYTVFHGNGNHETRMDRERRRYGDIYDRYISILKSSGVHILEDSSELYTDDIMISGINLEEKYYSNVIHKNLTSDNIEEKLGKAQDIYFNILLAHSPLFIKAYSEWGADLTLAGHFHGGTIRLPGIGGIMTPQFQFFNKYCAGIHKCNGRFLIISRGIGTHSINIRINNKPQLIVVELKRKSTF